MSKQRPDPDQLANELKGASGFFRRPTPPPGPAPEIVATDQPRTPEPVPAPPAGDGGRDVRTSRRHDVARQGFDINRATASHDTLRLAVDETRALEELKAALKWDHDLTVSKNDICRVALHALIEDFRARGAGSAALKRLRQKLGRQ